MSTLLGRKAGTVTGVKATGSMIVVEMLGEGESMNTVLIGNNRVSKDAPQGYVLEIGPALKAEEWGVKVGDRVLLQGTYVPVPGLKGFNGRFLGIVEAHSIKGVLQESHDE